MRILKFIVDGQQIKKDPECNFDNIVPGTTGYLSAHFTFSDDWNGYAKAVGFWANGKECEPQIVGFDGVCDIPAEATRNKRFEIVVMGKHGKSRLITGKIEIVQNGR